MSIVAPFFPSEFPDGLLLNQQLPLDISDPDDSSFFFMVRPSGYQIVPGKFRSVVDSISQADGVSMQAPYIDGLVATITVEYWETLGSTDPSARVLACAQSARNMDEILMGFLNALRVWTTDPNTMQRYIWTPTGAGQRALTDVLLASWPTVALQDPPPGVQRTFSLGTPYPYAIDLSQSDPVLEDGSTTVLTNNGNANFSPVMQIQGPATVVLIENNTTGEFISYDSTRPPGSGAIASGHYAEIDFFQGSIFMDGDGADLVAYLDPTLTDFFTFAPGQTSITVTGADVKVLYNDAWL